MPEDTPIQDRDALGESPDVRTLSGGRAGAAMFWGQLAKVLEVLLTLGIGILAVRALHPARFGTYSVLTNLAGAGSALLPVVAMESLGAVLPRIRRRDERLFVLFLVTAVRVAVIAVLLIVLALLWHHARHLFGLAGLSYGVFLLAALYWLSQDAATTVAGWFGAEVDLRPVAFWRTLGLATTLAAVVAVVVGGAASVAWLLAAVAAGYAVSALGLYVRAGRRGRMRRPPRAGRGGRMRRPPRATARYVLGFARTTWPLNVVGFVLLTQVDVLLIAGITHDRRQAAYYAAAVGVIGRVQLLLISGWSNLIIPIFGHALVDGGMPALRRVWRAVSELWLLIALPLNAFLIVCAHPLIRLLFGPAYEAVGELVIWVAAFNIVTVLLLDPPCVGALWALDRQGSLLRFRIFTAVLNLGLGVVLIWLYGALGAVIATGAAAAAGAVMQFALTRRLGAVDFPTRVAAAAIFASALGVVPALVIQPAGNASLVLALLLGFVGVVVGLAVMRPLRRDHLDAIVAVDARLKRLPLRFFVG